MQKKLLLILIIFVIVSLGTFSGLRYKKAYYQVNIPQISQTGEELTIENIADRKIAGMSLEQKQGAMYIASIPDTTLSGETVSYLRENNIGGVILMSGNIQNEAQVKQLTTDLKVKVNPKILIAIDQEGGTVVRIPWDKYATISAREMSSMPDEQITEVETYRSNLLKGLGINMILGPVVDLGSKGSFIYSRSYSDNPEEVAQIAELIVQAHQSVGIISVPKHFPGHGKTTTDSHDNLPHINISRQELYDQDLYPYKQLTNNNIQFIMSGHIVNSNISSQPASLSEEYINILEDDLGFKGLTITDDLKMTGEIQGGIDWGINLSIESKEDTLQRMRKITPEDEYLKRLVVFKYTAQY